VVRLPLVGAASGATTTRLEALPRP
jgi:hypothetical protein